MLHLNDIQVGSACAAYVDGDRVHKGGLCEGLDVHGHGGAEHERLPLSLEVGQHLCGIARSDLNGLEVSSSTISVHPFTPGTLGSTHCLTEQQASSWLPGNCGRKLRSQDGQ